MNDVSKQRLGRTALGTGMLLALVLVGLAIHNLTPGTQEKKHSAPRIIDVQPVRPESAQQPAETVKPPEVKVEVPKAPQPSEPTSADNKPAGTALGVDAEGKGPGNGFDMEARPGNAGLLAPRSGSGGRAQFSVFTSSAQQILLEEVSKHLKLKNRDYRANYKVWLDSEGNIERFELTPTGIPEIDDDLRMALAEVRGLNLAPPPDMPQPLRFQFTARSSG